MSKIKSYIKPNKEPLVASFDSAEKVHALKNIGIDFTDFHSVGMDAAPFTPAGVGAPVQFLQNWLPGVVKEATTARKIDELVGVTTVGNWFDEEIVQTMLERTGGVREYGDYSQTMLTDYNTEFEKRTIVRFEDGFRVGELARQRAQAYNINDADVKRSAAVIALEIARNAVGFYGYNNGANKTYGFLNDPNLDGYTTVAQGASNTTEWADKTYLEITADITEAANDLRTQSGSNVDPFNDEIVFAIADDAYGYLSTQNQQGTKSVREWIAENYKRSRIVSVPELSGANGGASVFYVYALYEKGDSTDNKRTFDQLVPARLKSLGREARTKHFEELYSNATAGVMCKRPYLVIRRSGI